ncbi:uncharacterized protein LOC129789132 isoform X2 [Lutzomyia longipalpis]|uniref:Secreted protein n=2 Tax=Lutzomyia longipalpis TaxID=7200 RepID=A0A1B0C926_LUTLO|nr:uncharacterized protein LOC129789132 isoform X2 [Lutzomyia longipalpis]
MPVNCVESFSFSLLALIMCYCVSGFPLNATVDQRQTGRYNIQFNIKDVAIIFQKDSVWGTNVGDDINYDYDYDYDHLTVKPDSWGIFNGTKPSKPPIYITNPPKPPTTPNKPLGTVTILGEASESAESESQQTSSTEKSTTVKYAWNGDLEKIPVAVIVDSGHKVKGKPAAKGNLNPAKRLQRPLTAGL